MLAGTLPLNAAYDESRRRKEPDGPHSIQMPATIDEGVKHLNAMGSGGWDCFGAEFDWLEGLRDEMASAD